MLNEDRTSMLIVLLGANQTERDPAPGCPDGHSKWHDAGRLRSEGLAFLTETDIHRIGAALQRRGLAAHKTHYGVTRWTLTEAGLGQARRLARSAP
jgi:hypothetical protein